MRQLHDHLSRYVQQVQAGTEVIVTMRGKAVARLTALDHVDVDPLERLRARGIISDPLRPRTEHDFGEPITPRGSVSDFVSQQRD